MRVLSIYAGNSATERQTLKNVAMNDGKDKPRKPDEESK